MLVLVSYDVATVSKTACGSTISATITNTASGTSAPRWQWTWKREAPMIV